MMPKRWKMIEYLAKRWNNFDEVGLLIKRDGHCAGSPS